MKENNKILMIDDELFILRDIEDILTYSLNHTNYELALNEKEAQTSIDKEVPALILCDINLGNKSNGIDFISQVKQKHPSIEVIYISAYSDSKIVEKAQSTFPLNYIVKPFNENQLIVAINLAFNAIKNKYSSNEIFSQLTHTELKVIQLIKQNYSSKKIAKSLFIAEKTVKNHRYNICKKLDLTGESNSLLKWVMNNSSQIPTP